MGTCPMGSGGVLIEAPQLQDMICGFKATAALNAPTVFTKLTFTIVNSTSGTTAKIFADSPVPCPFSSRSGLLVPGPRTVGLAR